MLGIIVVILFVVAVVAVAVVALGGMSPFARHSDNYRDTSGHLLVESSPHLETRDEFERRTAGV